ncbi:OmpA family protein [Moraxella lincolnii]|uniref:OmpA family protein n=1 Tax=Lwoffella lincolnii TaxID=90241 RepID=UPI0030D241AF
MDNMTTDAMTDIVGHLRQTVTPTLFNEQHAQPETTLSDTELSYMLDGFYALLTTLLTDDKTATRIEQVMMANDGDVYAQLWNATERNIISTELAQAHDVDKMTVDDCLDAVTPNAYRHIKSLAGGHPVATYLKGHVQQIRPYLPVWADMVLPPYLLGSVAPNITSNVASNAVSNMTSKPKPTVEPVSEVAYQQKAYPQSPPTYKRPQGSFIKALLPILALVLLGTLAWTALHYLQKDPKPLAQPNSNSQPNIAPVAVTLLPANFTVTIGASGELYACRGGVANSIIQSELIKAVENVFTLSSNRCFFDVSPSYDTKLPAMDRVASILAMMKHVPFATAEFSDNQIVLNAPNPTALQQLVNDVQALANNAQVLAAKPLDSQAQINQSLEASRLALASLSSNANPIDVARALSLQVINFDMDKAIIPEVNKPLLDKAADIIKGLPNISLLIMGHTDATADNAHNVALSQERATAIKAYLVAKGVDASKLMVKGMGEQYPIADNETEQGRFRNRRIEFAVYNQTQGDLAWYRDIPTLNQRSLNITDMSSMNDDAEMTQTPDMMNDMPFNQEMNQEMNQNMQNMNVVPNDQMNTGDSGDLIYPLSNSQPMNNNHGYGGMSTQELDDLANLTIVAEPAINHSTTH